MKTINRSNLAFTLVALALVCTTARAEDHGEHLKHLLREVAQGQRFLPVTPRMTADMKRVTAGRNLELANTALRVLNTAQQEPAPDKNFPLNRSYFISPFQPVSASSKENQDYVQRRIEALNGLVRLWRSSVQKELAPLFPKASRKEIRDAYLKEGLPVPTDIELITALGTGDPKDIPIPNPVDRIDRAMGGPTAQLLHALSSVERLMERRFEKEFSEAQWSAQAKLSPGSSKEMAPHGEYNEKR